MNCLVGGYILAESLYIILDMAEQSVVLIVVHVSVYLGPKTVYLSQRSSVTDLCAFQELVGSPSTGQITRWLLSLHGQLTPGRSSHLRSKRIQVTI